MENTTSDGEYYRSAVRTFAKAKRLGTKNGVSGNWTAGVQSGRETPLPSGPGAGKRYGVWTKPLARRTLTRYVIWQGNCNVATETIRSNVAVLRITKAIEYPLSNCPAKSGRLPPNVSILSDPAPWIPLFPPHSLAGSLQIDSERLWGVIRLDLSVCFRHPPLYVLPMSDRTVGSADPRHRQCYR